MWASEPAQGSLSPSARGRKATPDWSLPCVSGRNSPRASMAPGRERAVQDPMVVDDQEVSWAAPVRGVAAFELPALLALEALPDRYGALLTRQFLGVMGRGN